MLATCQEAALGRGRVQAGAAGERWPQGKGLGLQLSYSEHFKMRSPMPMK